MKIKPEDYQRTIKRIKNHKKKKTTRNNVRAMLKKQVSQNGDY